MSQTIYALVLSHVHTSSISSIDGNDTNVSLSYLRKSLGSRGFQKKIVSFGTISTFRDPLDYKLTASAAWAQRVSVSNHRHCIVLCASDVERLFMMFACPVPKNPFPSLDIIASFRLAWLRVIILSSNGHQPEDTFRQYYYLGFYYIGPWLPWCHRDGAYGPPKTASSSSCCNVNQQRGDETASSQQSDQSRGCSLFLISCCLFTLNRKAGNSDLYKQQGLRWFSYKNFESFPPSLACLTSPQI